MNNISDRSNTRRVYKLAILRGKKGLRSASSDNFEEPKFLRALQALQNGKFEFTSVSLQKSGLYDQAGFK